MFVLVLVLLGCFDCVYFVYCLIVNGIMFFMGWLVVGWLWVGDLLIVCCWVGWLFGLFLVGFGFVFCGL